MENIETEATTVKAAQKWDVTRERCRRRFTNNIEVGGKRVLGMTRALDQKGAYQNHQELVERT